LLQIRPPEACIRVAPKRPRDTDVIQGARFPPRGAWITASSN